MVTRTKNRVSHRELIARSSNVNNSVGGEFDIHFFNRMYTNILLSKVETTISIQIHPQSKATAASTVL